MSINQSINQSIIYFPYYLIVLLLSNGILNIYATLLKVFTVRKLYRPTYIYEWIQGYNFVLPILFAISCWIPEWPNHTHLGKVAGSDKWYWSDKIILWHLQYILASRIDSNIPWLWTAMSTNITANSVEFLSSQSNRCSNIEKNSSHHAQAKVSLLCL